MAKRLRLYAAHLKRKDRLSRLPDEVLVLILSYLSIDESVRTSVLSHRWKNVWTDLLTSCLNFDASKIVREIEARKKTLKEGRKDYITWVNKLLDLHRGSNLDEFTIRFCFGKRDSHVVDKWINYAMHRGVKRLEIDLKPFKWMNGPSIYTFPMDCYNFVRSSQGSSSIKFLKSLSLKFVNVTEEIIMYFLSNSPLLERLSVCGAEHLLKLKVVGSSLQLKYFEIGECSSLKNIEIAVPNLLSFSYSGKRICLSVGNLPLLAALSLDSRQKHFVAYAFGSFSSFFSQLETLRLPLSNWLFRVSLEPRRFFELANLKHLLVILTPNEEDNFCHLSWLLNSCPSLHKLSLETTMGILAPQKEKSTVKCSHQCLKVVEISGIIASRATVELALFFLKNDFMLDKLILERQRQLPNEDEESEGDILGEEMKRLKREGVERIKRELPPGVELIIL